MESVFIQNPDGTVDIGTNNMDESHDIRDTFMELARDCIDKGYDKATAKQFYENLHPALKSDPIFQSIFPTCFDMESVKAKMKKN